VTKVAVLGAGSWGTAIAARLADQVPTVLWARDRALAGEVERFSANRSYLGDHRLPERLHATASVAEALEGASLVVLAVPAQGLRGVLEAAVARGAAPGPTVPVLSLVKGMEVASLLRPSQIVAECWSPRRLAVLTGPNLAAEILAGQPSASVVASQDESLALELQDLLSTATLRVYTNRDVVGCEVAGVVKNVMAIATGMAAGLGLGENTRAALVTRALAELTRLGVRLGGDRATFAGLAGVGDLVATCTSPQSRNFSLGLALGRGTPLAEVLARTRTVAEGLTSCRPVVALAHAHGVEAPVAEQVVAVCHEGMPPRDAIPLLMGRAPRAE
jgi:glycerol-3-phosphate dehydrogenase (NAD(P)+)